MDYITWLKELDQFHNVPRHIKYRDLSYQEYLEALLEYSQKQNQHDNNQENILVYLFFRNCFCLFLRYLKDFQKRSLPLVDTQKVIAQFEKEFEERWADEYTETYISCIISQFVYIFFSLTIVFIFCFKILN